MKTFQKWGYIAVCVAAAVAGLFYYRISYRSHHIHTRQEMQVPIQNCSAALSTLYTHGSVAKADTMLWVDKDNRRYTAEFTQASPFDTPGPYYIPGNSTSDEESLNGTAVNCANTSGDCEYRYTLQDSNNNFCPDAKTGGPGQFVMHVKG